MSKKLISTIMIAAAFSASLAQADSVANSSVTSTSESGGPSLLDRFYLNYFGIYHGASIKDPASSYTVDRKGAPGSYAINFDSEITPAYMVTRNIGVGLTIPFVLVPVMGQGIILGDLGVKAFDKHTVSYRGFDLYTNLMVQAPTSKGSQTRNMSFAVKMTPYFRYSIPRSRFSVGAWTEEKAYFGVTTDKTFKLYGAPYVNYRLTSNFALNLEYEMEAHHNVGDQGVDFTMYQTDLEPGVVWMITPKIIFNPYLQIFTTNQVSADNMAVGAVISATVL